MTDKLKYLLDADTFIRAHRQHNPISLQAQMDGWSPTQR